MTSKESAADVAKILETVLAEVYKRTKFFPVPPEHFDPRAASDFQLRYYGIPSRPDRNTQPNQYTFWWKMFSPPLRFLKAEFSFPPVPLYNFSPRRPPAGFATRHESSLNWSGAYITPTDGEMFVGVSGYWQVPTSSIPASDSGGIANSGKYRSSAWIGLDGQRLYRDSSLPQIGTSHYINVVNGQPVSVANAWWQWWARIPALPPIYVLPLPVKPGDLIMCSLSVIDYQTVRLLISNKTTGNSLAPFQVQAPDQHLEISGATAEWILERPAIFPTPTLYDLPDYNTEVFSNCFALSAPAPGSTSRERELVAARYINMRKIEEHPHRTFNISVAEYEGDQEVATVYCPG